MANNSTQRTRASLISLPIELRLLIFSHYCSTIYAPISGPFYSHLTISLNQQAEFSSLLNPKRRESRASISNQLGQSIAFTIHPILHASRQLRQEYLSIFLKHATVIQTIDSTCYDCHGPHYWPIEPAAVPKLERLKLRIDLLSVLGTSYGSQWLETEFLSYITTFLQSLTRLREVGLFWLIGESQWERDPDGWRTLGWPFLIKLKKFEKLRYITISVGLGEQNRLVERRFAKSAGGVWGLAFTPGVGLIGTPGRRL